MAMKRSAALRDEMTMTRNSNWSLLRARRSVADDNDMV
jgi:hypothetical protein